MWFELISWMVSAPWRKLHFVGYIPVWNLIFSWPWFTVEWLREIPLLVPSPVFGISHPLKSPILQMGITCFTLYLIIFVGQILINPPFSKSFAHFQSFTTEVTTEWLWQMWPAVQWAPWAASWAERRLGPLGPGRRLGGWDWCTPNSCMVYTRWCPPSYKLVYNPNSYRSAINHSEIGVMFANLANWGTTCKGESHLEMDDLGVPPLLETSIVVSLWLEDWTDWVKNDWILSTCLPSYQNIIGIIGISEYSYIIYHIYICIYQYIYIYISIYIYIIYPIYSCQLWTLTIGMYPIMIMTMAMLGFIGQIGFASMELLDDHWSKVS